MRSGRRRTRLGLWVTIDFGPRSKRLRAGAPRRFPRDGRRRVREMESDPNSATIPPRAGKLPLRPPAAVLIRLDSYTNPLSGSTRLSSVFNARCMDHPVLRKSQCAQLALPIQAQRSQGRFRHLREVLKHFAQKKDRHLPGPSYRQARRQTRRCLPRRTRSMPKMRPSHAHPRGTSQGQTLCQKRKRILP